MLNPQAETRDAFERTPDERWESVPRVTAYMVDAPLRELGAILYADAGVSLSFPPEYAERRVFVRWNNRDAFEAFTGLAGQLDLEAYIRGPVDVELSPAKLSDVRTITFGSGYDDPDDLKRAVQSVLSQVGKAEVVGSTLIVSDVPPRLDRVASVAQRLRDDRGQWLLEVKFIELSESARRSFGVDWRIGGSGQLTIPFDVDLPITSPEDVLMRSGAWVVDLLAEASIGTSDVAMLASTTLYVVDGGSARSEFGQQTPVPLRSVSDQGTVTTQRFETISTGVILQATVRELGDGRAVIELVPEVSSVTGFIESAPIVALSRLTVSAVMASGDVLLLAGLDMASTGVNRRGLPVQSPVTQVAERRSDKRTVLVVVRAQRVRSTPATVTP